MSQKLDLQQLKSQNLEEVKAVKEQLEKKKSNLEALKTKGGQAWTSKLQEELDNVALSLVDVNELYDEKEAETKQLEAPEVEQPEEETYKVAKGTEKMVHLSIVRGRRFNSNTGKEISKPFIQLFTYAEWQVFKKNFKGLGYTIMKALHDPYGDAAELVVKDEE